MRPLYTPPIHIVKAVKVIYVKVYVYSWSKDPYGFSCHDGGLTPSDADPSSMEGINEPFY